jgi:hypothetical protein
MKIDLLAEPEMEFGAGRHIDVRFGLMNYGPFDVTSPIAPKRVRVAIVGSSESLEGTARWLEHCRAEIPAKQSRQPNLFPRFPGFAQDHTFHATVVLDSRLQRTLPGSRLDPLVERMSGNQLVLEAVTLFLQELEYLVQNASPDVMVCAVPSRLLTTLVRDATESIPPGKGNVAPPETGPFDFHHLLKAKAMHLMKPLQLILPATYGGKQPMLPRQRGRGDRRLQDEATRAWNIHTAMYYKAGGTPWRIPRRSGELASCDVGISFYRTLDRTHLLTSVAQVFNERGDGIIVRGGLAKISKEDRQPHLAKVDASRLLDDALKRYHQEHRTFPARVAVHKTSAYAESECEGFLEALNENRIDSYDLLTLQSQATRLFRVGAYPPLRGTLLSLDGDNHLLYTRGSVDFFATYPGMYVPRALGLRLERANETPRFLASEVLSPTKMNWNNTQFDGFDPITIEAARQVGAILKYVGEGDPMAARYSFYM